MQDPTDLVYRIDDHDALVYVSDAWDRFAVGNDGAAFIGADVLSRPIWNFITDETTRALYRDMFKRIREGRSVQFTFRCDSPHCRRFMTMAVSSAGGGAIEFRTRVDREEARDPVAALDIRATRSDQLMRVCGWCCRVDADGAWLEVEEAVARLRLFEEPRLPRMSHGICEACYATMTATVST